MKCNFITELIHDNKPIKCTKLFLIYLYCTMTLHIVTCFDPQGTIIKKSNKLTTFVHSLRGAKESKDLNIDMSL